MREEIQVTGIILYATLVKEYDKRLVILTKERGKITVFANGARKAVSQIRAASQSFVMGTFTVFPGRDSYTLVKAEVREYFSGLPLDMEKLCYASYVCEFMSYYTREGCYCVNELNLLYVTLKALEQGTVDNQLIRYAFEVRLMDIEGQGIHAYTCVRCNKKELKYFNAKAGGLLCEACGKELKLTRTVSETLIYTLQYIQSADLTKLYAFQLSEEAMAELKYVADRFREAYIDREFKSLEILSSL